MQRIIKCIAGFSLAIIIIGLLMLAYSPFSGMPNVEGFVIGPFAMSGTVLMFGGTVMLSACCLVMHS